MKSYARDPVTDRVLYALHVNTAADVPNVLNINSSRFACLIVWDSREASIDEMEALILKCLRNGASYIMCWGSGCKLLDGVVDQTVCHPSGEFEPLGHIMTTCHSDELEEALWFMLRLSWPDDASFDDTKATLAITVGSPEWALRVDRALANPEAFVREAGGE